jgi:hypothetical protein
VTYRQQTREELEQQLAQLHSQMDHTSFNNKPTFALQIQAILYELARRDQGAQTTAMLDMTDKMAGYTKQVTWLTWAIAGMTLVILGLTIYMAVKP